MNKERILLLADAIEQHSIPDLGFNMADYRRVTGDWPDQSGHDCKTTGCIAGWAVAVLDPESYPISTNTYHTHAQFLLNISRSDADALFLGEGRNGENLFFDGDTRLEFTDTTPQQAAKVLRIFAETGKIDWLSALEVA